MKINTSSDHFLRKKSDCKDLIKIMKICLLFLFAFTFQLLAIDSNAQDAVIALKNNSATVSELINEIEKQTDYLVVYSNREVDTNREINFKNSSNKVSVYLNEAFSNTDIGYDFENNYIVLSKKTSQNATALAQLIQTAQQGRTITGRVTDSEGQALPGVTVIAKGTTHGTITNVDGDYSISNIQDNTVLQFSFMGMVPLEIEVEDKTNINIRLEEASIGLDEVVAIGYGTMSKRNITTAISKVNIDDVPKAASSNVGQLLLGRAAGLQSSVISSQPGGAVDISIRGAGTPIYVVDGIVMPAGSLEPGSGGSVTVLPENVIRGGLAGLNPEDIESVEILKDASASIYGIGAAQGVVLITTKKGREGPLRINYDGNHSLITNYKYLQMLNANQYMEMVNLYDKEQYLYYNNFAPYGPNTYSSGWSAPFSETAIENARTTNWVDHVLKNGSISNHNLTISGGTKTISYYISGNYFSQNGTVSNSSMKRYALRSNISAELTSFLKLSSIVNVNRNRHNNSMVGASSLQSGAITNGALGSAVLYPPHLPLLDNSGNYTIFQNVPNPVALEDITDLTATNGVYLNFTADLSIIKDVLNAKLLYGNNNEQARRTSYIPSNVYFRQRYEARGNVGTTEREHQTLEATLSFNRDIRDILHIDAVLGSGRYFVKYHGMNVAYTGQHDAIGNDNLGSISGLVSPGSFREENEKRSQFARIHLDFLDRYVISSTLRRDGTDKFFPSKKYALFPSVAVAWKLFNESFLHDIPWINLLKIRASYGETGSDNLGTILYGSFSPSEYRVMFDNNSVQFIPYKADGIDFPNVTWQKTTMKNVGLDFSLLKDRITGSFDIFQNEITNMLGNANTPGLSMFSTYPINGAHQRRQGWDANINSVNIQFPNFRWSTLLNLSKYNALWIERMPNYDYQPYQEKEADYVYARYYYETNGIINSDLSNMPASQPQIAQIPGYPIIVDRNNDGEITIDDIKRSNGVPDLYVGLGNTFRYENFDLDIFMYSQLGIEKYNYAIAKASTTRFANQGGNSPIYAFRLWNSQNNTDGTLPGIAYQLGSLTLPGNAGTDLNYQNATFIRVRNITLGYNIVGDKLGVIGNYLNNARFYFDVQNALTFTKYEGYDPEIYTGGAYRGGDAEYPQTRTFSIGIKATF